MTGLSGRGHAGLLPHWEPLAVLLALAIGAVIRGRYVIASDFPLRDGGMFFVMTRELQKAHFSLPAFTSYNSAGIPFDYPPLGFYVAGLISTAGHIPLLTVFQYLPFAVSVLTIGAFYALARSILTSRLAVVAATLAFAMLPGTFFLTIAGGGVTRSLGLLFATLALHQIKQMYASGRICHVVAASILSGLTALSHPETPVFLAVSAAAMLLYCGRNRTGLRNSALVAAGTLVVAAPWWVTVVARHGPEPFLRAAGSGSAGLLGMFAGATLLTAVNITAEAFFPVLYALAILGLLCRSQEARRFLGWWAIAVALFDARGIAIYVTVPLALLAGVGTADGLLPLLHADGRELSAVTGDRWRRVALVLGCIVIYATVSGAITATQTLRVLSPDDRAAMKWVAGNTPETSTFLVIDGAAETGTGPTGGADRLVGQRFDNTSEWFPALANRRSVATPQGREWTDPDFAGAIQNYFGAQACGERNGDCLEAWSAKTGAGFQYVYLAKESTEGATAQGEEACCWPLRSALRSDGRFTLIYDGPGATVFALRSAGS